MHNGFVDLQVNGYGGIDFNSDDLTADALHSACGLMREHGVAAFLGTVITDDLPLMRARIETLVRLRDGDALVREMMIGLHIEGPFINPAKGYVGAHPPDAVQPASADVMDRLLDSAAGLARIVTLAPECDPSFAVIRRLAGQSIVVSAGHCNPDLATLNAAIDAGLSMFTHLGNGCPAEMPRHDNIIQRALSLAGRIRIGFIADGVHIPRFALKNYLAAAGVENCFVVSDAMSAAGLGPGMFRLGRNHVRVGDDLAARSADGTHLVGSAVTVAKSVELLRSIGLSDGDIQRLTVSNPLRWLENRP
jgi:N-acetylglucosamine-6-phosphate deacetylase